MLIGILGEIGVGKSTVAEMIAQQTAYSHILPFAKPLKDLARSIGWNGKKDAKGRRLLQLLGTDICRECIDPNWHTNKWVEEVIKIVRQYDDPKTPIIIADDLRFLNEASTVHASCGKIIRVVGRRNGIIKTPLDDLKDFFRPKKHKSETEWTKILHDYWINNDCSRTRLQIQVTEIVRQIQND